MNVISPTLMEMIVSHFATLPARFCVRDFAPCAERTDFDHFVEITATTGTGYRNIKHTISIDAAADHFFTFLFFYRQAFTGKHAFIHVGRAAGHHPICRDLFPWLYYNVIIIIQLIQGNIFFTLTCFQVNNGRQ